MDILTMLMVMMLVVLVVIVVQLRRTKGGVCNCPIDDNWVGDFGRWVEREDQWDNQVQEWIVWAHAVIQKSHPDDLAGGDPPSPPPCKFGSC